MLSQPSKPISRRRLLGASLALGLGGLLLKGGPKPARAALQGPRHLVWVWQFSVDGPPNILGARIRDAGLGMLLKTHDGLHWMSEYDRSPFAVSGPAQIAVLANYYEAAGVPFHAWAVIHGTDPVKEARMAAEVLAAGARSLYLDVEPHAGFWRGSPADAEAFGRELRRLQPSGHVIVSIDPRPWVLDRIPLREFLAFSDEIAPQNYWRTFDTPANHERFAQSGFPVPPGGVTPEFLLTVGELTLKKFGRPIVQVGQGATPEPDEWRRFIEGTYATGGDFVTVWRYGVTNPDVFNLLRDMPARQPPALLEAPAGPGGVYVVQAGDTLSKIAAEHGVTVEQLVAANGLSDPDRIAVGQELRVPGGAVATAAAGVSASPAPQQASRRTHTVGEGDTLYAIAGRYGSSVDAIARANSLTNPDFLSVGQALAIP